MLKLQPNIGKTDRMIRIFAGVVIVGLGLYFKSWWGVVGLIPIATAVLRWCPAYEPLKISTVEDEEKAEQSS
ncbi:MAG: hypothetical protein AXA67_11835 [Methylothermaceae bacteria B42]|nr:MAG: hypothetical protein AXA67_11835 [Methylothermaceae bacteria B42]